MACIAAFLICPLITANILPLLASQNFRVFSIIFNIVRLFGYRCLIAGRDYESPAWATPQWCDVVAGHGYSSLEKNAVMYFTSDSMFQFGLQMTD